MPQTSMPTIGQPELLPRLPSLRLRPVPERAARRGGDYHCSMNDYTLSRAGLLRTVRYMCAMANGILIADEAGTQVDAETMLKGRLSFPRVTTISLRREN